MSYLRRSLLSPISSDSKSSTKFLQHPPQQVWIKHFQNIELQNSLLSNINDNGDNNEKKLKHPVGKI